MGISPFSKSCLTARDIPDAVAPNPNPGNYRILERWNYKGATLLKVKYNGCTNFEGIKLLLFQGAFTDTGYLDPHFDKSNASPIARFKPDKEGLLLADQCARLFDVG